MDRRTKRENPQGGGGGSKVKGAGPLEGEGGKSGSSEMAGEQLVAN